MSVLSLPDLPITTVLSELLSVLDEGNRAVLMAPPGAGKTTLVPLALLDVSWRDGKKIIVLEPRRLAARAAAHRMADLLGEKVGEGVGYRVRFDTKVSKATIIEIVTQGVFTRMLAEDPGLETIAAVLFDEFHERSLDGDLALALCLDLQHGLREDLRLLPMSATLDGSGVAKLLDAPVIESSGRQYPVDVTYQDNPPRERIETIVASAVRGEIADDAKGSILVFLPGQREIERTADLLKEVLPDTVEVHKLYGALSHQEQDAAIRPPPDGKRKIVLASAIAETSLTIEGITCVIDSGLSRQPVFEPATGLTRLQTVRASKAEIDQRAGRAGRLGPGRALRLWRKEQTAALPDFAPPEIVNADLSALLLDLTDWGVTDPNSLQWMDPPPEPALAEARTLLKSLGAVGDNGLTEHGRAMRRLPLPPRFSHMVVTAADQGAGFDAALLALALQERGAGGRGIDLEQRLEALKSASDRRSKTLTNLARSITNRAGLNANNGDISAGVLLALAYPDRIAQRGAATSNGTIRYRLANGRGAELDATENLAKASFIVVADMAGRAGAARILAATEITKAEVEEFCGHLIEDKIESRFDKASGSLVSKKGVRLGALQLVKPKKVTPDLEGAAEVLHNALIEHGLAVLPWGDSETGLRQKLAFLHTHLPDDWPDVSDKTLLACLDDWLMPFLQGQTSFQSLANGPLRDALLMHVGMGRDAEIANLLPGHFDAPSGSRIHFQYESDKVVLRVRPQELFGLDTHPTIMGGRVPVEIELLSPAGRPIQITRDLPGFWRGSWRDVRADLRGRYPKHPWPEDPLSEPPTKRVKPRKR